MHRIWCRRHFASQFDLRFPPYGGKGVVCRHCSSWPSYFRSRAWERTLNAAWAATTPRGTVCRPLPMRIATEDQIPWGRPNGGGAPACGIESPMASPDAPGRTSVPEFGPGIVPHGATILSCLRVAGRGGRHISGDSYPSTSLVPGGCVPTTGDTPRVFPLKRLTPTRPPAPTALCGCSIHWYPEVVVMARKPRVEVFPVLNPKAAGIDVHADWHWVAVPPGSVPPTRGGAVPMNCPPTFASSAPAPTTWRPSPTGCRRAG